VGFLFLCVGGGGGGGGGVRFIVVAGRLWLPYRTVTDSSPQVLRDRLQEGDPAFCLSVCVAVCLLQKPTIYFSSR